MAGGELWGVWAQTITNDTTAANVEKYGEIEDMAEAYRDGFAKDFCDGQTSPTPPRWPDDGMQLLYFYDRESAELVSQFLRGDIDDRIAGGMLAPTVTPSWSSALETVADFMSFTGAEDIRRFDAATFNVPTESIESLSTYTQTKYENINIALREGLRLTPYEQDIVRDIDAVMSQNVTPIDIMGYRGVNRGSIPFSDLEVGQSWVDKALVSTSYRESVAGRFSQGVLLDIEIPANTHCVGLSTINNLSESELLLARDTRFTITGISEDAQGRMRIRVRAEN